MITPGDKGSSRRQATGVAGQTRLGTSLPGERPSVNTWIQDLTQQSISNGMQYF